ncbi:MAG: Tn3 family transposase [Candidatus Thiodiazotropha sp.]
MINHHGINQVNFALLHLFGNRFTPRFCDFRGRIQTGLYGFSHPGTYDGYQLKPIRRIW